ncbi:hypothetical protein H5410_025524 [Solanum commersonii]|uniref:50S ribosomal protein L18, chloroplast n=1 Tax=Solanum commersonii TaxID=4109 RepID=A0A9J5YW47_SOLCO|nr:hypothetical protein H5410_025524 [Solanum commersonii]
MATMALSNVCSLKIKTCELFGICINHSYTTLPIQIKRLDMKPLVIQATAKANFGLRFNGTPEKPRLSVFCSEKQLYATLIDDQNKKCLFYGSTLQKSIRGDPPCSIIEAAERVGEKLVQTCVDLNIDEISTYDRNGFARGDRMQAFEIAISRHGFLFK